MGCDGQQQIKNLLHTHFNPRTRVGCDDEMQWGNRFCQYFNPRTRVGCDAPINMGRIFFCLFQSTHPRGVRLSSYSLKSFRRNFNPRTRVGCDYFRENCYYPALISIHAPAWGATGRHTAACAGIAISIHAPAWGATLFVSLFHIKAQFQSTHPRGVRPCHYIHA